MDYTALMTGVGAILGVILAKGIDWYNIWRKAKSDDKKQDDDKELKEEKQKADISIPVNEQAVKIYGQIVESLRADMDKMIKSIHEQDALLLNCREEKIGLKTEKVLLLAEKAAAAAELEKMRNQLKGFEERMLVQEKKYDSPTPTIPPSPSGLLPPGSGGSI